MLPRTDILINRIRQESDTVDENSLNDFVLTNYINDAQRTIQNIIFQADHLNNVFVARKLISAVPGQIEYDLPDNVFADTSIIDVFAVDSSNRIVHRYDLRALTERTGPYGYSIENKKLILSHTPSYNILVRYNYRMPLAGKRAGKIDSITGQDLTLSSILSNFETTAEYVTVVDKYGNQKKSGLYIDSFASPTLTVEGDLSDASVGDFVVAGRSSSSHSLLPDEAETLLKTFVARKVFFHISSKKVADSDVFTKEERQDLIDLFEDKHSDIQYPTVTDVDYLDY